VGLILVKILFKDRNHKLYIRNRKAAKTMVTFVILTIAYIFFYFENNTLATTNFELSFAELPSSFNNYKILQISDLHGKEFGKNNKVLISKIKVISPDIIVLTGDLITSNNYNEEVFLNFIDEIIAICPVYYVTGNHEMFALRSLEPLDGKRTKRDIYILRNEATFIRRGTDSILLMGLDDPQLLYKSDNKQNSITMSNELDKIINKGNRNTFKILLCHRPEQFELYAKYNINLIFAGHAHGGQFRLPLIGGFYVPGQGLFPKYDGGKYVLNNTAMVVSRGLGNGSIPLRTFNRPEIVVVTLKKD
jgi:uncharacterized protein